MSTIQCASVVTETINYYLHNKSDIYMCTIDASKAFDCVNLFVLFNLLRKRNFCPLYLRFLMYSYCNQRMRVRWNSSNSREFLLSNGVKQGGVLSPLLFSVYLDDLLCELRQANVGCHMNGYFVGAVIYADDITLLGPTRSSILSMLSVCDVYARNIDILFNPAKTNCIFSPAYPTSLPGLPLHFTNTDIVFVPSCTFLGISVSSHDISDRNIPQSVQKLYRRSSEVMSDFKSLSRNVKSQLFNFLFRCIWFTIMAFFNNSVKLYYTAWRKVIRKAWCLPFTTHCRFLHTINNSLPIDVQLEKRCLKFLHSCLNSSNEVVKSISLSSIQQSFSTFGENYRYFCHKYKIMPYMFRSDFPIIIKQIHLYVDDHHGPHH